MAEASERGAYLRALGIEQWHPRAIAAEPVLESPALNAESTAVSTPIPASVDISSHSPVATAVEAPPVVINAPDPVSPTPVESAAAPVSVDMPRNQLQGSYGADALALAKVQWRTPPNGGARLAVLGIDACGSNLKPRDFEQDWAVLQKMLAAIGEDIEGCAVGGLSWSGQPSESLQTPYALILVDSGEDAGALINHWQDKLLTVQGAQAVIAPHPRMFTQGVALKRQAWASLQMLQQLWSQ